MARTDDVESSSPRKGADAPNAVWFKPLMIGFMLLGLAWVLVFYISSSATVTLPIPGIGAWNLAVGFGIALIGFIMATRWR
jgi:hypothetical protein